VSRIKKVKFCERCIAFQEYSGQPHCEKGYDNAWNTDAIRRAVPLEKCPKPLTNSEYVDTPYKEKT